MVLPAPPDFTGEPVICSDLVGSFVSLWTFNIVAFRFPAVKVSTKF